MVLTYRSKAINSLGPLAKVLQWDAATLVERLKQVPMRHEPKAGRSRRKEFADYLRQRRTERGFSQAELAQATGKKVSQSYIAKLERQACDPPRYGQLRIIADSLQLGARRRKELYAKAGLTPEDDPVVTLEPEDVGIEASHFTMIWVIGEMPIEFTNETLFETVLNSISNARTTFVYWLPPPQLATFDDFLQRLDLALPEKSKRNLRHYVGCIVTPPSLCVHQIAIYNPLSKECQGRLLIRDKADRRRPVDMEQNYTESAATLFCNAYDRLKDHSDCKIEDIAAAFTFSWYYPQRTKDPKS